MGREETLELLMACGQGPYNVRRPEELILWFCQRVPGAYTWQDVQRLLDYLGALYLPGGRVNPHSLIDAMYKKQGWYFDDLFQSPGGERYMFRGYLDEETAKAEVNLPLDRSLGDTAKFCKWYYRRANNILGGRAGWIAGTCCCWATS